MTSFLFQAQRASSKSLACISVLDVIDAMCVHRYLEENFGATYVKITEEDDKQIREVIKQLPPSGTRYPEQMMHTVNA